MKPKFAKCRPVGIDTALIKQLSRGDRKRLGIARSSVYRALAMRRPRGVSAPTDRAGGGARADTEPQGGPSHRIVLGPAEHRLEPLLAVLPLMVVRTSSLGDSRLNEHDDTS